MRSDDAPHIHYHANEIKLFTHIDFPISMLVFFHV